MVVDTKIGKIASVIPSIWPSHTSVAVGGVRVVISHSAVNVSNISTSTTTPSVSSITISCN